MAVMIGAKTSERSLGSHVGNGSKEHCLAGDFLIMVNLAYHSSMVCKRGPILAGKAKAGVIHSVHGETHVCAGKL